MSVTYRRIVTGHDAKGCSIIEIDGGPGAVLGGKRSGLQEFWAENGAPADNSRPGDPTQAPITLETAPMGSKFRFFSVMPRDPAMSLDELEKTTAAGFEIMQASHCRVDTTRDVSMHKTRSLDYVIVLQGEVTLLLDASEVDLKPFDVVVQRGTNHGWIAKGDKPALMAGILIDALPLEK